MEHENFLFFVCCFTWNAEQSQHRTARKFVIACLGFAPLNHVFQMVHFPAHAHYCAISFLISDLWFSTHFIGLAIHNKRQSTKKVQFISTDHLCPEFDSHFYYDYMEQRLTPPRIHRIPNTLPIHMSIQQKVGKHTGIECGFTNEICSYSCTKRSKRIA